MTRQSIPAPATNVDPPSPLEAEVVFPLIVLLVIVASASTTEIAPLAWANDVPPLAVAVLPEIVLWVMVTG